MRKLLILMLVLGMASAANAAFTLMVGQGGDGTVKGVMPGQGDYYDPVDSELILAPSDYLWVGIHNDTDGVPGAMQKGTFFFALVTDPQVAWTGNWTTYEPPLVPNTPDNYYFGGAIPTTATGLPWAVDLWYLDLGDGLFDTFNLIGVLDAKELHCEYYDEQAPPVMVVLLDGSMVPIDTILIHQIPEPMTIALLGLGGLLLRRRK